MADPLVQLLYASAPTSSFNISDIDNILAACSRNNTEREVTGFLIYDGETFVQLLEGPPDAVETTIQKIKGDKRHENIRTLVYEPTHSRNFGSWFMAFENIEGEETHFGGNVTKPLCRALARELSLRPGMGPQTIGKFLKKIVF